MSEMRERIALLERELEESGALVSEMRERIAFLEREIAGKDAILSNIAEAVKDISPLAQEEEPSEPPEAPQTATEQPGRTVLSRPSRAHRRCKNPPRWPCRRPVVVHYPATSRRPAKLRGAGGSSGGEPRSWWRRRFGS